MNTRFTFRPADVVWFDTLPARPQGKTAVGRMSMFVDRLRQRPGVWGQYPHAYKNGALTSLWIARKNYPKIEWEARGQYLYGRAPIS
jgi:hypothetical protein